MHAVIPSTQKGENAICAQKELDNLRKEYARKEQKLKIG